MVKYLHEQYSNMASNPTLTDLAVKRLISIRDNRLSEEVQKKAALCLLDYLGALCSGLLVPWTPALMASAQGQPYPVPDWALTDERNSRHPR